MEKPFGKLAFATFAYLALPVMIFSLGWMDLALGAAAVVGVLTTGAWFVRATQWGKFEARQYAVPVLTALGALLFSGLGGVGLQNWDYDKHNALLHDLISQPWPVVYPDRGDPALAGPLVYYTAWYLPAALVGKALGWAAANVVWFLWGWLGLSLALAWVQRLVSGRAWAPIAFLFFSGLDVVAVIASGKSPFNQSNLQMHHWAGFAQYTHNLAAINWVPHHAIPMWLATGFMLHQLGQRRIQGVFAIWLLLPLWSPWAFVGTAPFVLLVWFRSSSPRLDMTAPTTLLSTLLGLFYLSSNHGQVVKGFAWTFMDPVSFLGRYAAFVLLEFGLIAAAIWWSRKRESDLGLFGLTVGMLLVLPLYRFGISGDLTMRASMPPLFVLAILGLRGLDGVRDRRWLPLAVVLGIGALSPLHELVYSAIHYRLGAPEEAQVRTLPYTDGRQYAKQFLGDPERLFWRRVAR